MPTLNSFTVQDALTFIQSLPATVPMFLFSPPYNLGNTSGGGFAKTHYSQEAGMNKRGGGGKWGGGQLAEGYSDFDDNLPHSVYVNWQFDILSACFDALSDTGAIFYNHKPRILNGTLVAPMDYVPPELRQFVRQEIIWARAGGVNFSPSFYVPTHERIVIIAKPNFRLKSKGASGVGDVWYFPQEANTWHPAPFPLPLAIRAIETVMPSFVVDPFAGSGTTAVAAKTLGVGYICADISPSYVQRAEQRVHDAPGPIFTEPLHEQKAMM